MFVGSGEPWVAEQSTRSRTRAVESPADERIPDAALVENHRGHRAADEQELQVVVEGPGNDQPLHQHHQWQVGQVHPVRGGGQVAAIALRRQSGETVTMPDNAPRKVSTTAILVAAVRASHLRWTPDPIFSDEYASAMVTPFWRQVANNRLLNWLVVDVLLRPLKPVQTVIIVRIRYAEDRLWEAITAGVEQYVILGAGLDTFALRCGGRAERLRIYEVDHPGSQEMKRRGLERIAGGVPSNLNLVPVDFETDRLDEALIAAGFDPEAPAFFSWLGVTCYLTEEAISATIGQIAAVAAPGSSLVVDYRYPRRLVPAGGQALVEKMDRFVERRGEPMLSEFSPEEFAAKMEQSGFVEVDTVSPEEQVKRYLQGRQDMPAPPPNFAFAQFQLQEQGMVPTRRADRGGR